MRVRFLRLWLLWVTVMIMVFSSYVLLMRSSCRGLVLEQPDIVPAGRQAGRWAGRQHCRLQADRAEVHRRARSPIDSLLLGLFLPHGIDKDLSTTRTGMVTLHLD